MTSDAVKRKLTTIMAADVVGYSGLMAGDEELTLRTLQEHRGIVDSLIQKHGGRIFNTAGDSVLAEFGSAVEAVRCAISIQEDLRVQNAERSEESQMWLRIGVNVGDVMVEGDDLFGDGVNVAARLEGLAEKGGICVSGSTFEQVKNKLSIAFEDIGEQTVKNIPHPVSAFQVMPGEVLVQGKTQKGPPAIAGFFGLGRRGLAFGILSVAVAAVVVAVYLTKNSLDSDSVDPFDGHWQATLSSISGCRNNETRSYSFTVSSGEINEPQHPLPKTGTISADGSFSIRVTDRAGNFMAMQTGVVVGDSGEGRLQGRRQSCGGAVNLVRLE